MLLFWLPTVPASLSDNPMPLAGYTSEPRYHAPRGRALPTLTIAYALALTAGSISVQVQKNGLDEGDPAALSTTQHLDTVTLDCSVAPGDRLTCLCTSSADLTPVDQPLIAVFP